LWATQASFTCVELKSREVSMQRFPTETGINFVRNDPFIHYYCHLDLTAFGSQHNIQYRYSSNAFSKMAWPRGSWRSMELLAKMGSGPDAFGRDAGSRISVLPSAHAEKGSQNGRKHWSISQGCIVKDWSLIFLFAVLLHECVLGRVPKGFLATTCKKSLGLIVYLVSHITSQCSYRKHAIFPRCNAWRYSRINFGGNLDLGSYCLTVCLKGHMLFPSESVWKQAAA